METIKTLQFINGNSLYRDKTVEIRDNGTDIEFFEVDSDTNTENKLPTKIVKWLAEAGRLNATELVDYIDVKIPQKIEVKEMPKKVVVENEYTGEMIYKGRSKKIEKGVVEVLSDNGTKCKIKDSKGSITVVAKSTLTSRI